MNGAALLGGLFNGVLSALPVISIGNCCCLWITGGGIVAAYVAQQSRRRSITGGEGAFLGLLAGIIGAGVWLAVYAAVDVVMAPLQERMLASLIERSVDMPPDVREWFTTFGARAGSPLRYAVGVAFQLFAGLIFSTLGGVIGAIFFRRDTRYERDQTIP